MIVNTKIKDHNIYLNKVALVKLNKRELTLFNLYAYYLEECNDIYRSSISFKKKLCSLYDSAFQIFISAFGGFTRIIYSFCALDSAYLNDPNYNNLAMFDFFEAISSRPLLVHGHFSKRLFKQVKNDYRDDLLAAFENPGYNAKISFLDELLKGSDVILRDDGSLEDLESIEIDELEEFYLQKIKNLDFSFYSNYPLAPLKYQEEHKFSYRIKNELSLSHQDLVIPANTSECYINMAIEANLYYGDANYLYGFILNKLLGGGMNSLLFREIREKYSLCYSINSKYNSTLGLFLISLITDKKNSERAISLIKEIIANFTFTEEEFEIAKLTMINGLISKEDYVFGFIIEASVKEYFDFYLSNTEKIALVKNLSYEKALELKNNLSFGLSVSYGGKDSE